MGQATLAGSLLGLKCGSWVRGGWGGTAARHETYWLPGLLEETMDQVEPSWEQDLRPLLTQLVPQVAVRQAVRAAMKDLI